MATAAELRLLSCPSRLRFVLNWPLFWPRACVAAASWVLHMGVAVTGYHSDGHSAWEQYVHFGLGMASLMLAAVAGATLVSVAASPLPKHTWSQSGSHGHGSAGDDALRMTWGLLWTFLWAVTDLPMALLALFAIGSGGADHLPSASLVAALHEWLAVGSIVFASVGAVTSALTLVATLGESAKTHRE